MIHASYFRNFWLLSCALISTTGFLSAAELPLKLSGNIVDVVHGEIFPGTVEIADGKIVSITRDSGTYSQYLIPGLVDAHVHIESSMLSPAEFAHLAVVHGTVATVSDPHEIANVMGVPGVEAMIANGKTVPFKFYFGAPSCVPATGFETAGAILDVKAVDALLRNPEILYLTEMMNFPGVIHGDPDVLAKLESARRHGKTIDGHAPGLTGPDLEKYVSAGIHTDHECFMLPEAQEKVRLGMKIIIREGSAARNFDALHPLLGAHSDVCMFGTDDCHPNALVQGHINLVIKRALALGYDPMAVLRCATLNPVKHYGLAVGLLQKGDSADLVLVDNLKDFNVLATYSGGTKVAEAGKSLVKASLMPALNQFRTQPKLATHFAIPAGTGRVKVIEITDGQLMTKKILMTPKIEGGQVVADVANDVLKLVVVNRYADTEPAVALIKNFGLKRGAIASSVAHDSHNIVAVGANDADLLNAVNAVIKNQGGLAVSVEGHTETLPLNIAGLMSNSDGYRVAAQYSALEDQAKALGSSLRAPFMTLSFTALLVIPELKLSDRGLFDGQKFEFTSLFER